MAFGITRGGGWVDLVFLVRVLRRPLANDDIVVIEWKERKGVDYSYDDEDDVVTTIGDSIK